MIRQRSSKRVYFSAVIALILVMTLACQDQFPNLAPLATAQPQESVTSPAVATPTTTALQAVPPEAGEPEPTTAPIQRQLTGAARPTSTPVPAGGEPFVDAPEDSGLTQASGAFSSTQTRDSAAGRFAISIDGSGPDLVNSLIVDFIQRAAAVA